MAISYQGNTSIAVTSPVYNLPFKVTFFTISNLYAGTTTITVSVTDGVTDILLSAKNMQLSDGDFMQGGENEMIIPAGNQIKIETDQLISYYFTIVNMKPEYDTSF
jgi:hypothetical protein